MLPLGIGPLGGGLKEDSKFWAELFLRIVGRGASDINGLDSEMVAWKLDICGSDRQRRVENGVVPIMS